MFIQIAQRIGIPLVLLVLGGVYYVNTASGNPQDTLLIKPVFYLMVILFIINAATDLKTILGKRESAAAADMATLKKIGVFSALSILLVVAMPYLGFVLSSILFMYAVLFYFKVENQTVLYLMPLVVSFLLYFLFDYVFSVPLPQGFLGF